MENQIILNETQLNDKLEYDSEFTILHSRRSTNRVSFNLDPYIRLFDKNDEPSSLKDTREEKLPKDNNVVATGCKPTMNSRNTKIETIASQILPNNIDQNQQCLNGNLDTTFVVKNTKDTTMHSSTSAIDMDITVSSNFEENCEVNGEISCPEKILKEKNEMENMTFINVSMDMTIVTINGDTNAFEHDGKEAIEQIKLNPIKSQPSYNMSVEMVEQSFSAEQSAKMSISACDKFNSITSFHEAITLVEDTDIDEEIFVEDEKIVMNQKLEFKNANALLEFYSIIVPTTIETKYEKNFEKLVKCLSCADGNECEEVKALRIVYFVKPIQEKEFHFRDTLKEKIKSLLSVEALLQVQSLNWERFNKDLLNHGNGPSSESYAKNKAYLEKRLQNGYVNAKFEVFREIDDFWKSLALILEERYPEFNGKCKEIRDKWMKERLELEAMSIEYERLESELAFNEECASLTLREENLELHEKLIALRLASVEKEIQAAELNLKFLSHCDLNHHNAQHKDLQEKLDAYLKLVFYDSKWLWEHHLDTDATLCILHLTLKSLSISSLWKYDWQIKRWGRRSIEYYFLQNKFIFKITFGHDIQYQYVENEIVTTSLELIPNYGELGGIQKFLLHYIMSSYSSLNMDTYKTFKDLPEIIRRLSEVFSQAKLLNRDLQYCCKRYLVKLPVPDLIPQIIESSPKTLISAPSEIHVNCMLLQPYGTYDLKIALAPGSYAKEAAAFSLNHISGHDRKEEILEHLSNTNVGEFYIKKCLSYFPLILDVKDVDSTSS